MFYVYADFRLNPDKYALKEILYGPFKTKKEAEYYRDYIFDLNKNNDFNFAVGIIKETNLK